MKCSAAVSDRHLELVDGSNNSEHAVAVRMCLIVVATSNDRVVVVIERVECTV